MARAPKHYVNNKQLYETYVEFFKKCEENKAAGLDRPPIPKYAVEAIMLISQNVAKRGNFSSYPFLDEMIEDAIENCIRYFDRFDINYKTKNPFAYLTQIITFAFIRKIKKEKEYLFLKKKIYEHSYQLGGLTTQQPGDTNVYSLPIDSLDTDYMNNLVAGIEESKKKKKEKEEEEANEE